MSRQQNHTRLISFALALLWIVGVGFTTHVAYAQSQVEVFGDLEIVAMRKKKNANRIFTWFPNETEEPPRKPTKGREWGGYSDFQASNPDLRGITTGDYDGDGRDEFVVISATGEYSFYRWQSNGNLQNHWNFPHSKNWQAIATGNFDDDPLDEIVAVRQRSDNLARIAWFDDADKDKEPRARFAFGSGWDDGTKTNWLKVEAVDINSDGIDEIVTLDDKTNLVIWDTNGNECFRWAWSFDEPHHADFATGNFDGEAGNGLFAYFSGITHNTAKSVLFVFEFDTNQDCTSGRLPFPDFWQLNDPTFGTADAAAGDLNGDGKDEIVTIKPAGGAPYGRILGIDEHDQLVFKKYFADTQGPRATFGAVAVGDLDSDGYAEIVTLRDKAPQIWVYNDLETFEDGLHDTISGSHRQVGSYGDGTVWVDLVLGDFDGDSYTMTREVLDAGKTTLPFLPLLILHDPPGDRSKSTYVRGRAIAHELCIGTETESSEGFEGSFNIAGSGYTKGKTEITYEESESCFEVNLSEEQGLTGIATDFVDLIGPGRGDVYVGQSIEIAWQLHQMTRTSANGAVTETFEMEQQVRMPNEGLTSYSMFELLNARSNIDHQLNGVTTQYDVILGADGRPVFSPHGEAVTWRGWLDQLLAMNIGADNEISAAEQDYVEALPANPHFTTYTTSESDNYLAWRRGRTRRLRSAFKSATNNYSAARLGLDIEISPGEFVSTNVGGYAEWSWSLDHRNTNAEESTTDTFESIRVTLLDEYTSADESTTGDDFYITTYRDKIFNTPLFIVEPQTKTSRPWEYKRLFAPGDTDYAEDASEAACTMRADTKAPEILKMSSMPLNGSLDIDTGWFDDSKTYVIDAHGTGELRFWVAARDQGPRPDPGLDYQIDVKIVEGANATSYKSTASGTIAVDATDMTEAHWFDIPIRENRLYLIDVKVLDTSENLSTATVELCNGENIDECRETLQRSILPNHLPLVDNFEDATLPLWTSTITRGDNGQPTGGVVASSTVAKAGSRSMRVGGTWGDVGVASTYLNWTPPVPYAVEFWFRLDPSAGFNGYRLWSPRTFAGKACDLDIQIHEGSRYLLVVSRNGQQHFRQHRFPANEWLRFVYRRQDAATGTLDVYRADGSLLFSITADVRDSDGDGNPANDRIGQVKIGDLWEHWWRGFVFFDDMKIYGLPEAPTNLSARVVTTNQINLSWQDNADDEHGFTIERKVVVQGDGGVFAAIATVGVNTTNYTDTSVEPGPYAYRVRAYHAYGASGWSNEAQANMEGAPPVAPTNLSAGNVSTTRIDLFWQDNADGEHGFEIERKTKPHLGREGPFVRIATVGADVTCFSNTSVNLENAAYTYRVRAFSAIRASGWSNEVSVGAASSGGRPKPPGGGVIGPPVVPNPGPLTRVCAGASGSTPDAINVGLEQVAQDLPTEFSLSPNYPNPFNPTTTIAFALPQASRARLEIYNLLGQRVATLVDETLPVGRHEVRWEARRLPSGTYVYRLKAGDFVEVRRMLLVK